MGAEAEAVQQEKQGNETPSPNPISQAQFLSWKRQKRFIFDKPEDGVRKIVLATNVAETSITINDVVFCGKAKETSYDALNNTPCLLPSWIPKAAARQDQNAVKYLKIIGALDNNENLTVLGHNLSILPVEPKLGKMLLLGAIFNCLDLIMTIVAGLSVRDPFMMPSGTLLTID